jgi:hypothetical protein
MARKLLLILALCLYFFSSAVSAADVVKWVDAAGRTHFGNAQFAPAGAGVAVPLHPANGMHAPDLSILTSRRASKGPMVIMLSRSLITNPRGWRGFSGRSGSHRAGTRSRSRRI